jgi:hypothetical protein
VLLTCELCNTTRWFNTVLAIVIPPSSVSVTEVLRLDSWYFGLPSGLGVSSSLSSTLFCFFCLCPSLSWSFVFACLCVCHQQSHRFNQQEVICLLFSVRLLHHHLLWLSYSRWGCHSGCPPHQVMGPRWTDHASSSLKSDFVNRKETTPLAC